MATPYKMKGSPMKRNFGISPVKDVNKSRKIAEENKLDASVKESNYRTKLKTIKPDRKRETVGPTPTSPPVTPKSHPVTPPKKNREDTVKGNTKFKSDVNKFRSGEGIELIKNRVKKAYDYITKK